MNGLKTILTIIIIAILLLYIIGIVYIISKYVSNRKNSQEIINQNMMNLMMMNMINNMNKNQNLNPSVESSCDINSSQTDFFKDSVKKAEKVLMGNVFLDGYKYGISRDLTNIDNNMKKSIIVSMQYMMIDPVDSRNIEQRFRLIVEQENVPLYFVILHEAIKKIIPFENNPSITEISNEELLLEIERRKMKQKEQENSESDFSGGKIVSINQQVA